MTGFGAATATQGDATVTVEVKTVNHRFLDLHVRLAREYAALEPEIHQLCRNHLQRGRIEINVSIQASTPISVALNKAAARSYFESARILQQEFELQDFLDLKTLIRLPGVLQESAISADRAALDGCVMTALKESLELAMRGVLRMRRQEGETLTAVMLAYLDGLNSKSKDILRLVSSSVEEYKRKLENRLAQLVPLDSVDPQRLAQEVAIIADRSDISEELARLSSHLDQFHQLLGSGVEIGKKLDFLLQEMQREVNTLLSKTGNLEITRLGISMKADIEKLREQAQNVE
jgi:uncharacterized protein (TIGR00255 family)